MNREHFARVCFSDHNSDVQKCCWRRWIFWCPEVLLDILIFWCSEVLLDMLIWSRHLEETVARLDLCIKMFKRSTPSSLKHRKHYMQFLSFPFPKFTANAASHKQGMPLTQSHHRLWIALAIALAGSLLSWCINLYIVDDVMLCYNIIGLWHWWLHPGFGVGGCKSGSNEVLNKTLNLPNCDIAAT